MVNGIDTSTGIPLDDSSMIQQIPLGGQVFPFADWDASARPTRNPIYGDDILPTSALVAGQMPTQDAAQSVHTDGNHALLVSDVNGGGGGQGIYVPPIFPEVNRQINLGPGSLWPTDGTKITKRYIYGLSIAVVCTLPVSGSGEGFFVEIQGGTNNQRGQMILAAQFLATSAGGFCPPYISNQVYPVKIDALAAVADTSWVLLMNGISGTSTFYATIGVLYGD